MAKRSATVQSQTNRPAVWMPRATLITPQRTFWNVATILFSILYLWEFIHISLAFQSYIFESSFLYLWFVKHISLKKRSYSLENRIRYLSKTLFYLYGTPLLSPGNVPFLSGFNPFLGRKHSIQLLETKENGVNGHFYVLSEAKKASRHKK